jgi:hypothetical protein
MPIILHSVNTEEPGRNRSQLQNESRFFYPLCGSSVSSCTITAKFRVLNWVPVRVPVVEPCLEMATEKPMHETLFKQIFYLQILKRIVLCCLHGLLSPYTEFEYVIGKLARPAHLGYGRFVSLAWRHSLTIQGV